MQSSTSAFYRSGRSSRELIGSSSSSTSAAGTHLIWLPQTTHWHCVCALLLRRPMPPSHVLKQTDAGGYNRGARAHSGWNQARGDHVLLLKAIGVTLLALGGFGMVHRIIYIARLVRSVPRLFWIILLLLFQIFEVAILWPSSAVVGGAGGAGPRDAGTGKVQTLHSQLPLPSIEALNQKWTSSGLHNLPNLNECTGSCQCDKDRSEGRSAVAWTVNQIEHGAGAATRALLPWHPDGAGAVVQCVFGDRIVKGQLIPAASGDVAQQQVGAQMAQPAPCAHSMRCRCRVSPRRATTWSSPASRCTQ